MMKTRTLSLLGLMCLVTATLQQDNPCVNAFTERVKADSDSAVRSLVLDTAVDYTGTICNTEWSVNKTCCNKDKVLEVAEKRINEWKTRLGEFVNKAEEFGKKMAEKKDKIHLQIKNAKELIETKNNDVTFNQKVSAGAKTQVTQLADGADKLMQIFDSEDYKKKMEAFKSGIKMCFDEVNKFRLGTFCGMCSTRAATFIVEEKVAISEAACTKVVSACVGTWKFMFNMIQTIKTLVQVSKIQNFASNTGAAVPPVGTTTGADASADVNDINVALDTVSLLDPATLIFSPQVGTLCDKLLTFDRPNPESELPDNAKMDEVVAEQKKDDDRITALPSSEKAAYETKLAQFKTQMETKRTTDIAAAAADLTALDSAISSGKGVIDAKKGEIQTLTQ